MNIPPHMSELPEELEVEPWAVGMRPIDALFVREWLVDMNTSRAALASGLYKGIASARTNAWKTLRRPVIMRAIAAAMTERSQALNITAKTVLGEAWRCYLAALNAGKFGDAYRFLVLVGQHVDVRAFRNKFGAPDETDEDDEEVAQLANLTTEELETLARLTRKASGDLDEGATPSSLRH